LGSSVPGYFGWTWDRGSISRWRYGWAIGDEEMDIMTNGLKLLGKRTGEFIAIGYGLVSAGPFLLPKLTSTPSNYRILFRVRCRRSKIWLKLSTNLRKDPDGEPTAMS
jgi:hypothetical protein